MERRREESGAEKDNEVFKKPDLLAVAFMGAIERFAYTSCIIVEVPHWVTIWLAFKVLTRWKPPQERTPGKEVLLANIYLVGNLLSVIFSVIGGLICKYGFHINEWSIFSS